MSASTKPSQWRAFTIFDTKAYKKKAWTKPHKWDMTSIRMKVNFVSVCSQWSSTKKGKAIQISHGVVIKEILLIIIVRPALKAWRDNEYIKKIYMGYAAAPTMRPDGMPGKGREGGIKKTLFPIGETYEISVTPLAG